MYSVPGLPEEEGCARMINFHPAVLSVGREGVEDAPGWPVWPSAPQALCLGSACSSRKAHPALATPQGVGCPRRE